MLNDLIRKYVKTLIAYSAIGKDSSLETKAILEDIHEELQLMGNKCNPAEIDDKRFAMLAFFDMYERRIGNETPALLCYYFSTLLIKDKTKTIDTRLQGNEYRAFIIFRTMDKWDGFMGACRTMPMYNYRGNLNGDSFYDLLLLSDVYRAWNTDPDNRLLNNLKKQAPNVASMHPEYSRDEVIKEGELAHEALFCFIKNLVVL